MDNNGVVNKFLNALRNADFLITVVCAVAAFFVYSNMEFVRFDMGWASQGLSMSDILDIGYTNSFVKTVGYIPLAAAILAVAGCVLLKKDLVLRMAIVGIVATPVEFLLVLGQVADGFDMEISDLFEVSEILEYVGIGVFATMGVFVLVVVFANRVDWNTVLYGGEEPPVREGFMRCAECGTEHPVSIDCPHCSAFANRKPEEISHIEKVPRVEEVPREVRCETCGKMYDANKFELFCPHCNSPL